MNQVLTFLKEAFLRCLFSHLSTYIHILLLWYFHSIQLDSTHFPRSMSSFLLLWEFHYFNQKISLIFFLISFFTLHLPKIGFTTYSNTTFFLQASPYFFCALLTLHVPIVNIAWSEPHLARSCGYATPILWTAVKQSNSLHLFGI